MHRAYNIILHRACFVNGRYGRACSVNSSYVSPDACMSWPMDSTKGSTDVIRLRRGRYSHCRDKCTVVQRV
eukprot:6261946-Pyramimonas_sp.AAC.1